MLDASLFQFAKAGEPRPVAPGDYVRIDQEPIFTGIVKASDDQRIVIHGAAGLFLAEIGEVSILRRAA
jgi:hypothetical protein